MPNIKEYPPGFEVAAGLSVFGDGFVIATVLCKPAARGRFTLRLLACFAAVDLAANALSLAMEAVPSDLLTPATCVAPGALNWYTAWCSFLWTVPYALAVHLTFASLTGAQVRSEPWQPGVRFEMASRALCWGIPGGMTLLGLCLGLFGQGGGSVAQCLSLGNSISSRASSSALAAVYTELYMFGPLWVAVATNIYALAHMPGHMRRIWRLVRVAQTSEVDERALIQKTRQWPRLLSFILTLLVCHAPAATLNTLVAANAFPVSSVTRLIYWIDFILPTLHGFVNAILFAFLYHDLTGIGFTCCKAKRRVELNVQPEPPALSSFSSESTCNTHFLVSTSSACHSSAGGETPACAGPAVSGHL